MDDTIRGRWSFALLVMFVCSAGAWGCAASGPNVQWMENDRSEVEPSGNVPDDTRLIGTSNLDTARDVAVGGDGAIYVAGNVRTDEQAEGPEHFFVAKYGSDLTRQWIRVFGGDGIDDVAGLALGASDSIFVGGRTTSSSLGGAERDSSASAAFAMRLDPKGDPIWTRLTDTPGEAKGGSIDVRSDRICQSSNITPADDGDDDDDEGIDEETFLVRCLDETGETQWQQAFDPPTEFTPSDIAVAKRDVLVAGFGKDAHVTRVQPPGDIVWHADVGTSEGEGHVAATLEDGSIYVAGTTKGALGPEARAAYITDAYLARLTGEGDVQWRRSLGASTEARTRGIVARRSGAIATTGRIKGSLDDVKTYRDNDVFVAQHDAEGEQRRVDVYGNRWAQRGVAIAEGPEGTLYVVGRATDELAGLEVAGESDAFLMRVETGE